MRRKLKMQIEKEKILLEITPNSTLVLTKIMKKKMMKTSRAIWGEYWLKQIKQKGAYNNIIKDRYRFY